MRKSSLLAVAALLLVAPAAWGDAAAARARLEKEGIPVTPAAFLDRVVKGDAAHVPLFLEAGIDPAAQNPAKRTALWLAVEAKQLETLRALLAAGVKPNETNAPIQQYGKTIVFEAVDTGDAAYVHALVEAGADARKANEYGVPPLAEAARTGHLEMCEILLQAGADPNAAPGGYPLLFGPVRENHLDVVKRLLAAGAKLGEHKAEILEAAGTPAMRALLEPVE
jgi:ankyrin repeat protein